MTSRQSLLAAIEHNMQSMEDQKLVLDKNVLYQRAFDMLARQNAREAQFRTPETKQGLVRMPIDFVVGTLRTLSVDLPTASLLGVLRGLAQIPFVPPDVAGWPANEAWISTSSAQVRLQFSLAVAERAASGGLVDATAQDRPRLLSRRLGLDGWTDERLGKTLGLAQNTARKIRNVWRQAGLVESAGSEGTWKFTEREVR